MKFISLRKEVDKVLSLVKYDNAKVKISHKTYEEPVIYLYKHSAIIASSIFSMSPPDFIDLAQYIADHPHISKVLVPFIGPRNIGQFVFKLNQSEFFYIINRNIRMVIDIPYEVDVSSASKDYIDGHDIRYHNYHKRPLSYYIKPHELITVYCSFLENNRNRLLSNQAVQYTVKREAIKASKE